MARLRRFPVSFPPIDAIGDTTEKGTKTTASDQSLSLGRRVVNDVSAAPRRVSVHAELSSKPLMLSAIIAEEIV